MPNSVSWVALIVAGGLALLGLGLHTIHGASAGSVRKVLEGLKSGGSYRYGDTSVFAGGIKPRGVQMIMRSI